MFHGIAVAFQQPMLRTLSVFCIVMAVALATPAAAVAKPAKRGQVAKLVHTRSTPKPRGVRHRVKNALASVRKRWSSKGRRTAEKTSRTVTSEKSGLSFRVVAGARVSAWDRSGRSLRNGEIALGEGEIVIIGRASADIDGDTYVFEADEAGKIISGPMMEVAISRKHLTLQKGKDGSITITNGVQNEKGEIHEPLNGTSINSNTVGEHPVFYKYREMAAGERVVVLPGEKVWLALPMGTVVSVGAVKPEPAAE